MKKTKILFLILTIILLTGCKNKYLKEIDYKEYKDLIENKETFALEVMRDGCSACKSFEPVLKNFVNEYKIEVKYINTDTLTDDQIDEFGISGTPTIIFYNKGEEKTVSSRLIGSVSKEKIINKFKANDFIK